MSKTFWASRDISLDTNLDMNDGLLGYIKIWDKEPVFTRPNNVFVGKVYMGMFDVKEWEGPEILPGEVKEVKITFEGV
jgi:hypothetical protein